MSKKKENDNYFDRDDNIQELKARSVSGSAFIAAVQVFRIAIQFVIQAALARLLFPSDYGLIALAYPFIGFLQLFSSLGLGDVVVQRQSLTNARVSGLFWWTMMLSLGLFLVSLAVAPVVAVALNEPDLTLVIASLAFMMPVSALSIVPTSLLARKLRFKEIVTIELLAFTVTSCVTVWLAMLGFRYWSLIIGQAIGVVLQTSMMWRRAAWRPIKWSASRADARDLRFGANLTGVQITNFLTTSGDNLIIGAVNGRIALGFYDRSYRLIVQPVSQAITPVNRLAVPLLSRLQESPTAYRAAYAKLLKMVLIVTLPPVIVCSADASGVVRLLLGERWLESIPIFAWVAVGGLTSGLYTSLGWLFISQGRGRELLRYAAIAAAISLTSFGIGAPFGPTAVAAAAGLGFVGITTPLVLLGATRTGPVSRGDIVIATLPHAIAAVVATTLVRVADQVWQTDDVYSVIRSVFLAILPFAIVCISMRTERELIRLGLSQFSRPLARLFLKPSQASQSRRP